MFNNEGDKQKPAVPENTNRPLASSTLIYKKITAFFNHYLEQKIEPQSLSPYPLARDGGLNPALKILAANNGWA
ncbi:hypothetical protein [Legionella rowbothamii]|uniref:hypothetical protein n=1 Tax=Legionella rowbothamii TaxID=96229 RepID=UPI0010556EA2|nr:hypothetical protein [Legionella rowbothamii]